MKTIADTRRENFRRLVKQLGGPREAGCILDMNENQISQLTSERVQKHMGSRLARKIEQAAGRKLLAPGQLDMPIGFGGENIQTIPLVDPSHEHFTPPDKAREVAVNKESGGWPFIIWDNANPWRPIGPLAAFIMWDDSMAGLVDRGDLVIVDLGVREPSPGSIVAVEDGDGKRCIRVLIEAPDGRGYILRATSDLFADHFIDDLEAVAGVVVERRLFAPYQSRAVARIADALQSARNGKSVS